MDAISLDVPVKFLPIDLLEIDSVRDVGPYDSDDEDARQPQMFTYEVNCLLNVRMSLQKR